MFWCDNIEKARTRTHQHYVGAMNSHIPCDQFYYEYLTPMSKITICAACITVQNCTKQQLRHGKSSSKVPPCEREWAS